MKSRILVVVMLLVLAIPLFGVRAQDGTIAEVLTADGRFTILLTAVETAGLGDALAGEGPLTVFAPTDEAFAAVPESVIAYLLANPELLANILTYHVVEGAVASADVTTMMAPTLAGEELNVVVGEDGTVTINQATVTEVDLTASNGVVHVIDGVLLPTIELPAVDPLSVEGDVRTVGSSTVLPVTEAMGARFSDEGYTGAVTVENTGTGGGFERFCVNGDAYEIVNASRAIRQEEVDACAALATPRIPLEFRVGTDALSVVVSSENDFVEDVTLEELQAIFSTASNWSDVRAEWPNEPIVRYVPGTDSGTFDYFVEAVFDEDTAPILNAENLNQSEDDNVLVTGVEGSPYAVAFFGYAYYAEAGDALRAVSIDGVAPTAITAENGEYPISRPLFIYSDPAILAATPAAASFINFYLTNVNEVIAEVGYFPASSYALNLARLTLLANTAAGM